KGILDGGLQLCPTARQRTFYRAGRGFLDRRFWKGRVLGREQGWRSNVSPHILVIRQQVLNSSFCKFGRNGFPPFSGKETHIFQIDAVALLFRRIWASDIKTPILQEIVVRIASARFSATGKACPAIGHLGCALVAWRGILGLLRAFF